MFAPMDRLTVAQRANVPPFHVMDMLERAAQRQRTLRQAQDTAYSDTISLTSGQPSTGAPQAVSAEAVRLLQSGDPLGYTPATGILELRQAIAGHHRAGTGSTSPPTTSS